MPFHVSCPKCQASYRVPDERIGTPARCKKCGESFSLSVATNPNAPDDTPDFFEDAVPRVRAEEEVLEGEFGRYEILRVLGKGGMGTVYLANDTELANRLVALKVPLRRFTHDSAVRERFRREARIGQEFRHDRFCAIYDMGQVNDRLYLSMAYIEGETLADRLKRTGPFSEPDAVEFTRKIALALADAHDRKIVHRDLKPSNVMVDAKGDVHIMDFGLAKRFDADDVPLTLTQGSLGTPSFMPPEQVKVDKGLMGPRSDIYSLGVILYQLLTGRLPYEGVNTAVVFAKILSTMVPKPPRAHRPELSPAVEAVCLKATAKKPRDRYESMRAFAEALLLREPVVPSVSSSEPVRPEVLVQPPPGGSAELVSESKDKGSRTVGSAMTALAAVVVLVAGALFGERLNRPRGNAGEGVSKLGEFAKPETAKPVSPKSTWRPLDVIENAVGMKLVLIPYGTFEMGSPEKDLFGMKVDPPKHTVRITRPFWMGQTEVTQEQYKSVMVSNPSWFSSTGGVKASVTWFDTSKYPVEQVSWFDVVAFCNALSAREGLRPFYTISGGDVTVPDWEGPGYRLPTEAEWEFACRAGSSGRYAFGNDVARLGEFAWFFGNSDARTHAVGTRAANKFGLFDMHGNVSEWCWDLFDMSGGAIDPRGPSRAVDRVIRGGSWDGTDRHVLSAHRFWCSPVYRRSDLGVRVARVQSDP